MEIVDEMNEEESSTFCSPCGSTTSFPFQDQYDIIDLSYSLNDQTIFWPGDEVLSLCMTCFHDDQFNYDYAAGYIKCPEHGGTHVDAPYHFNKNGITIEKIPLRQLICNCRVIDISEQCNNNRDYCLLPEDILNYERNYGLIKENEVVLIRTGWWRRYVEGSKSYLNYDKSIDGEYDHEKHILSFPGIGKEAATLLVERNINAVGIDTGTKLIRFLTRILSLSKYLD